MGQSDLKKYILPSATVALYNDDGISMPHQLLNSW